MTKQRFHHFDISALLLGAMLAGGLPLAAADSVRANSTGITLVEVPAGTFTMGNTEEVFSRDLCFNELPAHPVRLTQPFLLSANEVTLDQFRQFKPEFGGTPEDAPYATGMTWHDAVAFCEWLSRKEGKPYRLPTEAEWEHAARQAEKLGLQNLFTGPREWCLDWFGEYLDQGQTDPVGPEWGLARVVRGGCLDEKTMAEDYSHASHRAGVGPAFGTYPGATGGAGQHHIGFRVVQAPMPATKPWPAATSFVQQGVKQTVKQAGTGPNPAKPYFRKRHLLPVPPDNAPTSAIDAAGLHPSFRQHNHSPALTVCPNGDVLMVIYTSYREYEPEVSLIASRLRFGADEWDMPVPFVDFPGANDHAPMLFTEGGTVRLCWGSPHLPGGFPFQWIESKDNGATWSDVRFPHFPTAPGPHSRQPINSGFRGPGGTLYVASDAAGPSSVLWASDDNGGTWRDTGGRSAGRHTTYCLLKDGSILGMGGKNSDIAGFMPAVVSPDGGRTWENRKTVFPAQANNQRPSLLRLQSGRLFFAGDFQNLKGEQPAGVTGRGSYVALSEDEGQTWHLKKLIGTQPHENLEFLKGADTLGYSAACQAPNGMIHLITTQTRPCLHFELNEAWILSPDAPNPGDAVLMESTARKVADAKQHRETFPNGQPRVTCTGGIADDGRFLLHGKETWFYPGGRKQYEATYQLGCKIGAETLWRTDGTVDWTWQRRDDGVSVWTQFWPNGRKKAESQWRGRIADGLATGWDASGKEVSRAQFTAGQAKVELGDAARTPRGRSNREPGLAREGASCYLDREYRIVSLPPDLTGGDLLRTANDDDYSTREDHLALELAADSTVYVCYWAEAREIPGWLKQERWKRMDSQAGVELSGERKAYNVFAAAVPKGRLVLGGNERERTGATNMYFVVIKPAQPTAAMKPAGASQPPIPAAADPHTVALWLFDESNYPFATLTDAGPNEYDLVLLERGALVPGRFGQALQPKRDADLTVTLAGFEGNWSFYADPRVKAPDGQPSAVLGPNVVPQKLVQTLATEDWTLEFWLRAAPPAESVVLVDLGHALEPGVVLELAKDASQFQVSNHYAGWRAICPTAARALTDGQWHHVALVFDSTARQLRHWLDGQPQTGHALTPLDRAPLPAPNDVTTAIAAGFDKSKDRAWRLQHRFNLALGQDRRGKQVLSGALDEIRLSDVARYGTPFSPPPSFSRNYGVNPPKVAQPSGPPLLFAGDPSSAPVQLGSRRHLFIDDVLLAEQTNVALRCNPPVGWEELQMPVPSGDVSIFEHDGLVHLLEPDPNKGGVRVWRSTDGLRFEPQEGLGAGTDGIKPRNGPCYGNVFFDANPAVPASERFKLTAWLENRGIYLFVSSNGLHWSRNECAMLPLVSGGGAEGYWDDQQGRYVTLLKRDGSFRTEEFPSRGRSSVMFTTREPAKPWPFNPLAKPYFEGYVMPPVSGEGPTIFSTTADTGHVYRSRVMKYPWAPDVYLAFLWRMDRDDVRRTELAVSRDGERWRHFGRTPWYLEGHGDFREAIAQFGMIRRGDELWQYVLNVAGAHGEGRRVGARVKQRLDGFVALTGTAAPARAATRPLVFDDPAFRRGEGGVLRLNIASPAGARVGIVKADGSAIPGFSLADCDPIQADAVNHIVTWKGRSDVSGLAGQPVRLQFDLSPSSKLYAFQFGGADIGK